MLLPFSLSLGIACSDRTENGDLPKFQKEDSVDTPPSLSERMPEVTEENMKTLVRADYQGTFQRVDGVEDSERRFQLLFAFYSALAGIDVDHALSLLPKDMNEDEQRAFGVAIIIPKLIAAGRLDETLKFIESRLTGQAQIEGTDQAAQGLFQTQDINVKTAIAFWTALEPGPARIQTTSGFASNLAQLDPRAAVVWCESLDPDERQSAADSVGLLNDPQGSLEQLAVAQLPDLRKALLERLGATLASIPIDEARGVLRKLEVESELRMAEQPMIFVLSGLQWSKSPDFDHLPFSERLIDYLKDPVTDEGKAQANAALAHLLNFGLSHMTGSTIVDPEKSQSMERVLLAWLELDKFEATHYISQLPPDASKDAALPTLIGFLEKAGDTESAEKWRAELAR